MNILNNKGLNLLILRNIFIIISLYLESKELRIRRTKAVYMNSNFSKIERRKERMFQIDDQQSQDVSQTSHFLIFRISP